MKMFSTVRGRLIAGFALIAIFLTLQYALTHYFLSRHVNLVSSEVNNTFHAANEVAQLAIEGQKLRRYEKEFFIYVKDPKKRNKYVKEWTETHDALADKLDAMIAERKNNWTLYGDLDELESWKVSLDAYRIGFRQVVQMVTSGLIGETEQANREIQPAKNKFRAFLKGTAGSVMKKVERAKDATQRITEETGQVKFVLLGLALMGVAISIVLLFTVPRAIARPIRQLTADATRLVKGDLEHPVSQPPVRDFAELAQTLEKMRITLKYMIDRHKARQPRATPDKGDTAST